MLQCVAQQRHVAAAVCDCSVCIRAVEVQSTALTMHQQLELTGADDIEEAIGPDVGKLVMLDSSLGIPAYSCSSMFQDFH